MAHTKIDHWLDLWAGQLHDWQIHSTDETVLYYRRQGIVENLFDVDGTDFEGRADINPRLTIEIRTSLDHSGLRDHITKAWTLLRQRHVLLSARSLQAREFLPQSGGSSWLDKYFVYCVPRNVEASKESGRATITFLEDSYSNVDADTFWKHAMNCSRLINEKQQLARLFIFAFEPTTDGTLRLQTYLSAGHQISDGLTIYRWSTDLIGLLNQSSEHLDREIALSCSPETATERLPPAQESLYPPLATSKARLRWQWLITRILRHVRTPVPASFQNPLRRERPLDYALDMPQTYSKVLNYLPKPPLNTGSVGMDISERATQNLIKMCRQAGISRGSGSFVLVALVMMRLEERYRPNVALTDRLPFVGSFPVNPRPFLSGKPTTGKEDSLMLAFSDGVTLPFLPSSCDLQTSFRVLGRLAHRQLNQYQKKKRNAREEALLGSRSPRQLLPSLYLSTMERLEARISSDRRVGLNPQGEYQAKSGGSLATCGISSIGDVSGLISKNLYDVSTLNGKEVVADFRDLKSSVRAREGEFLVGSAGSKHHQGFLVSYDASTLDPEKILEWKVMLRDLLEFDMDVVTSKGKNQQQNSKLASKL